MKRVISLASCVLALGPFLWGADPQSGPTERTVNVERGDLSVLFRDNSESPQVLSGIDALFNRKDAAGFDAFDPDGKGASAGLNFEHIISGHRNDHNAFAPRKGKYVLRKLPDEKSVMLVRETADCPWRISSTLRYTVNEPHSIDFEFRCIPHEPKLFGERGYAVFFFADYMNDVADLALHFRGVSGPGGEEQWIAADGPPGPTDWNTGGTYRHRDAADLAYDADHNFKLNTWSYDSPRFTRPFYYGRAARDMVFILMFDKTHTETDEIRFSIFKFKTKSKPRPAWDFQYVLRKMNENQEYGFRGRLVWKKFVSPEDCLKEYEAWAGR